MNETATSLRFDDQGTSDIRCEWGAAGLRHLAMANVIIVVDVLSFSTSVEIAVTRGATVLPYQWKDGSAWAYAQEKSAYLAAPRGQGEGTFSLSPASLARVPAGTRLVLPSANGSDLAFAARSGGATVAVGCLRNASAVAAWAWQSGRTINVIPAGERWPDGSLRPAIEDLIGAGAILRQLPGRRSPEAEVAIAAFEGASGSLRHTLLECASGRELLIRGFDDDVELAAELNASRTVPILTGEAFVAATMPAGTGSDCG